MLSLESQDWRSLRHAYGEASDIPDLLRQLALNAAPKSRYDEEPWFTLWSSLCHQEDVYDASYATVPHIVTIGIECVGPIDSGFFLLPACIEVFRNNGRGPQVPAELSEAYFAALTGLHECAYRHASDKWDSAMAQSVAAALAAAAGQLKLAEAILKLDDDMMGKIIQLDI